MPTIDDTITLLERTFRFIQTAQKELDVLKHYEKQPWYEDERSRLEGEVRNHNKTLVTALETFDRYPGRHSRHFDKLPQFHQKGTYDASVFIMTKFPDGPSPEAVQLHNIIEAVKAEVQGRGYIPRIAQGPAYHRWLFDNVELFLLGCARGVAIVEDKYLPELNPNVAMEWGWMTGMGRQVLFLREEKFEHVRADWSGLLNAPFDWKDPGPGIAAGLGDFLPVRAAAGGP
jgi:hypothetical protein